MKILASARIGRTFAKGGLDDTGKLLKDLHKKMMNAEHEFSEFQKQYPADPYNKERRADVINKRQHLLHNLFHYRDSYINLLDSLDD